MFVIVSKTTTCIVTSDEFHHMFWQNALAALLDLVAIELGGHPLPYQLSGSA